MNCELFQGAPPAFLTYAAVSARTGLSISSIRRMAARNDFPAPVELMPRRPAFPAAEVERWCAQRIAERGRDA
jgi:predicted DNA-binding transcriptional regulator AlpA